MSVSYEEASWTPAGGRGTTFYRLWRPAKSAALLVLVHGFGEHGGRYRPLAEALAAHHLAVAVPDLLGHGRSDGRPGDLRGLEECLAPVAALTRQVLLPLIGVPRCAVMGHSFGGLLAGFWALRQPDLFTRLVLQSPLLEVGFPIPGWKRTAARVCLALWPAAQFSMDLDLDNLCHDGEVIHAYRQDPLVHHLMSARAYAATLRARAEVVRRAEEFRVPVLLLCGDEDRIISVATAVAWFERLPVDKRLRRFPGMYHELHHEPVREQVIHQIADWILAAPRSASP